MGKRGICLLLLTGALMLSGCGGEAVHTAAAPGQETQGETQDAGGAAEDGAQGKTETGEDEAQDGAGVAEDGAREETAIAENAAQDGAGDADGSAGGEAKATGDSAKEETTAAADSAQGEVEAEEPEMDEALRAQLTEEMLAEQDLDVSVVENAKETKGCTFTLPEGFEPSKEVEGMYVTGRYPIDVSSINYVTLDRDIALQLMTEESFKAQAASRLKETYGENVQVDIERFERLRIDGCPAFCILCRYQLGETSVTQLQYIINADKSYALTYSQTDDYDRMEAYEASAATIRLTR